jgi:rubrerythrin
MEIITGLISLIALIVFFVMAVALSNISKSSRNTEKYMRNMNRILDAWSDSTGIGIINTCKKCGKAFKGKPTSCPHCGDPKSYEE